MNKLHKRRIDPLASSQEKDSNSYGLKVAKEIASSWFNNGLIYDGSAFAKRREWIRSMRLYARGQQNLKTIQSLITRDDEDLSYHNLDWRPDNTAGKFVNIVANGISDDHYRLSIRANDPLSNTQRKEYQEQLEKEMYGKKLVAMAKEMLGVDTGVSEFVPDSREDLELHMELEYKQKQEIAGELLVQYAFDVNEWEDISERCRKDLVESGLAVVECFTDSISGINLREVDIENYIHSYVQKNNFSDKTYEGVVRTVTVSELRTESGLDDDSLREIIKLYNKKNNGASYLRLGSNFDLSDFLDYKIDLLDFTHKTSKRIAFKKKHNNKGGFKMTRKEDDFEIAKTEKSESVGKSSDTWYEGTYIVGSDIVYGYKESTNLVKDNLGRAKSRFISRATNIYNNELHSFLMDMIPTIDQIHITKLKLQHIIAEIKPSGAEIDIDMVANLAGGDKIDYKEIIRVFNAKGIVFKKRIADEFGNIKEGRAVEELHNGIPANLVHLLQVLQQQQETLREITGINPSRDGTQRHDSLVGINQAQIIASNTITQHISEAAKRLKMNIADVILMRFSDIFEFNDEAKHLIEMYENAIGRMNVSILEPMKNIHLHQFGLTMEMLPSQEELHQFEEAMRISLERGGITEDDMNQARSIAKKNPKYANQFLRLRRRKNMEEAMKQREEEARIKSESDIASAQAASQNRREETEHEGQVKIEVEKALAMIAAQKQDMLNKINEPIRREEYEFEGFKKKMDMAATMNLNKYKEDEKTKRQNKNNTDHSKMIEQRKKDLPPIDFDADNELDSFLNQFSGR